MKKLFTLFSILAVIGCEVDREHLDENRDKLTLIDGCYYVNLPSGMCHHGGCKNPDHFNLTFVDAITSWKDGYLQFDAWEGVTVSLSSSHVDTTGYHVQTNIPLLEVTEKGFTVYMPVK